MYMPPGGGQGGYASMFMITLPDEASCMPADGGTK
jgi:hypothetical protein